MSEGVPLEGQTADQGNTSVRCLYTKGTCLRDVWEPVVGCVRYAVIAGVVQSNRSLLLQETDDASPNWSFYVYWSGESLQEGHTITFCSVTVILDSLVDSPRVKVRSTDSPTPDTFMSAFPSRGQAHALPNAGAAVQPWQMSNSCRRLLEQFLHLGPKRTRSLPYILFSLRSLSWLSCSTALK